MVKGKYRAVADLHGSQQILENGTFDECAKWCEDVIHSNEGEVTVSITQICQNGGESDEMPELRECVPAHGY